MSFENVVLQYAHPHVAVYLEDNTTYTETFLAEDEPVKMIQCGMFAEGRDNKVVYCPSYESFIEEFGNPNYKLYGQACYNVAHALMGGYAGAYVLRVMPEDATFANIVIMARYKVISDDKGLKLSLNFTAQTITNVTTKDELLMQISLLKANDPDEDGYYSRPVFCVYQSGRGAYGNNTRFRIADITQYDDDDTTFREYRLDILRMEDTLVRKEYAFGSFDQDLYDVETKESLYLEDLVNDEEEGLGKVRIEICDDILEEILDMYNNQVLASYNLPPEDMKVFDFIYGRTMTGATNEYITYETTADTVAFTQETEGVTLESGSDGSFDISSPNRDEVYEELLIKAYNGTIDKSIKSKFSTPCDFMLDAAFPDSVKRAMVGLATYRQYDAMTYLDAGLVDTIDETIEWLDDMKKVWNYNVIKELHNYKIRDTEYTGKTIPVTTTYFLAELIPYHLKNVGFGIPMAMANARITDAVRGSFKPVIDPDDNDIKKILFNYRGNYYETVRYNVYQRGTANTTQPTTSDRMDEFNEYIVHQAVTKASQIMYGHMYNFAEPDDRARYQEGTNEILQALLGRYVRSCTVEYEMSKTDEKRNILRLKVRIVFKTVVKRGIVEIYLDPRVTD